MNRVLHITTHDEDCGIAKYQEQYLASMKLEKNYEHVIFKYSPNVTKTMSKEDFAAVLNEFHDEVKKFDIVHIQHEFGFYHHEELEYYIRTAKKEGAKIVVSVHTSPDVILHKPRLGGLSPRSFVAFARSKRHYEKLFDRHIKPLKEADTLLAHNELTIKSLIDTGIDKTRIIRLKHPVPEIVDKESSEKIKQNLHFKNGDVIFATVGFMHKHKGLFDAVKALKFLPDNYKLAIIGGVHPFSDSAEIYNHVTDLIIELDLINRVFITGFIKDDVELNGLIQEASVCVYPYDGVYYGKTSSGALNLALANSVPVVAYPTATIREIAEDSHGAVVLTKAFSYYELARALTDINIKTKADQTLAYAKSMSWTVFGKKLTDIYNNLI